MPPSAYFSTHRVPVEQAIQRSVSALYVLEPDEPLRFLAEHLVSQTAAPALPKLTESTGGCWTSKGWLLSLAPEMCDVVATALGVSAEGADEFSALRSLSDEIIAARLTEAGLSGLVPVIAVQAAELRQQAAATGAELNSKFSSEQGTFELAVGRTDAFYGGLEVRPGSR